MLQGMSWERAVLLLLGTFQEQQSCPTVLGEESRGVLGFSPPFVFSCPRSLWASPACSCSTTSQGSAAAATSSASPSAMVLTMMVPVLPWTWNAEQTGEA